MGIKIPKNQEFTEPLIAGLIAVHSFVDGVTQIVDQVIKLPRVVDI
jgi:hypothetical protein